MMIRFFIVFIVYCLVYQGSKAQNEESLRIDLLNDSLFITEVLNKLNDTIIGNQQYSFHEIDSLKYYESRKGKANTVLEIIHNYNDLKIAIKNNQVQLNTNSFTIINDTIFQFNFMNGKKMEIVNSKVFDEFYKFWLYPYEYKGFIKQLNCFLFTEIQDPEYGPMEFIINATNGNKQYLNIYSLSFSSDLSIYFSTHIEETYGEAGFEFGLYDGTVIHENFSFFYNDTRFIVREHYWTIGKELYMNINNRYYIKVHVANKS